MQVTTQMFGCVCKRALEDLLSQFDESVLSYTVKDLSMGSEQGSRGLVF